MASPTQLTLQHCRKKGVLVDVVEQFVAFPPPGHRKDFLGFIDMIAVVPGAGILGIQATSKSNARSRLKKARNEDNIDNLRQWLAAGCGFEVWGWWQPKGRGTSWALIREPITLEDIGGVTDADNQ